MGKEQDIRLVDGQAMNFTRVMIESGFLSPENKQSFVDDCLRKFRNLDSDVFPTSILSICFGDSDSMWANLSVKDAVIAISNWIEQQTNKKADIRLPENMFSRTNRDNYDFLDTGTFAPGEFFVLSLGHNQMADYDSHMHHDEEYGLQGYDLASEEQGVWALDFLKMSQKIGSGKMGAKMFGFKTENRAALLGIVDYVMMQAVLVAGKYTPMDSNGTWTAFPLYSMIIEKENYPSGSMLLARWKDGNIELMISEKYKAAKNIGIRFGLCEIPLEDYTEQRGTNDSSQQSCGESAPKKIKEQIRKMYDWTLPYYTTRMDDETCEMLAQRAKTIATDAYKNMSSYEKFVFNSNYALLNIMHHGFMHDIDYDTQILNKRMALMRFFVDSNINKAGDEKSFYPFYPEFAIINGITEPFHGETDTPITVGGELLLYTGDTPSDEDGIRIPCPIRRPSDGRNARDFLNLYFTYIVALCKSYYPNENLEEFKDIFNSWIDDKEVVPIMWAMMLKDEGIPDSFVGSSTTMKYVEIKTLDPNTGNILSGVDESTGKPYNFLALAAKKSFSHLIPTTLEGYTAPDKPGGRIIRIKLCEISGLGHFLDVAGEGTRGELESNYIIDKMSPPEFWYMTLETAQRYDCDYDVEMSKRAKGVEFGSRNENEKEDFIMRKQYQIAEVGSNNKHILKLSDVDTKQIFNISQHPILKSMGYVLSCGFLVDMWQENPENPNICWINTICVDKEPYDSIIDIAGKGFYPGMDVCSKIIATLNEDWFVETSLGCTLGLWQ